MKGREGVLTRTERLFLQAVAAAIRDRQIDWQGGISAGEWRELFTLSLQHKMFPLVLEAVYRCMAFHSLSQSERKLYQKQAAMQVLMQTISTQEYGNLLHYLNKEGLDPITTKGVVCRQLYPQPDLRLSADEDMLIRPEEFEKYHRTLIDYGMYQQHTENRKEKLKCPQEVSYHSRYSSLHVEVHTVLFPGKNMVYTKWDDHFDAVWQREHRIVSCGFRVRAMEVTDQLFYLICHMMKHFLYSGFGVRQICDLLLFSETYGSQICWERIVWQCREIQGLTFSGAVFRIARTYLGMDTKKAGLPEELLRENTEVENLLKDILRGGIYGTSCEERVHSSMFTLGAAAGKKYGRLTEIMGGLFPSATTMKQRYPILQRYPCLLPVMWGKRILHYKREMDESRQRMGETISGVLQTGAQRVELLKQYGMIPP